MVVTTGRAVGVQVMAAIIARAEGVQAVERVPLVHNRSRRRVPAMGAQIRVEITRRVRDRRNKR